MSDAISRVDNTTVDRNWMQLARDAHEGSKRYFDAGVRSQIDDDLRQFYGQHPQGSKYNSDVYRGKSKFFRPKTRAAIRGNEATAAEALFTTDDLVSILPEDEDDDMQVASASINQELLQYRLTKDIPWFLTCMGAYQDAQAVGVCLSYNYWQYNKKKGIDRPCIELKPPENFRFDAAADWRDVINTSPYLIEEMPMYVKDVKARFAPAPGSAEARWTACSDGELLTAAQPYNNVSTRLIREKGRTDSTAQVSAINDFSVVWVHRNIIEMGGQDYVYYTLAGSFKLLSKPKPIEDVYWHGHRPYTMGFCVVETHKVYPAGLARIAKDTQAEINEIANQRIDNVKLAMNKRWKAKRGAQVDLNSLKRNLPNSVTLVSNMDDVEQLEFEDVTASSYQEQDRLNLDFDDLTGTFSGSSVAGDRRMGETVGGMNIYNANNNKMGGYQLRVWIETWVKPTLRQMMRLEQKYESSQKVLALAGAKAGLYQRFGITELTDELLEQELTCNVNVGMNATDPTKQIERFMFGLTKLKEVLMDGVLDKYNIQVEEVVKEIFGKLGFRDGKRFFKFTGEDPRIAALQQMVDQLTQELKNKKPDPQLVAAQIRKIEAEITKLAKEGVKVGVETAFSAMQAGQVIAATPQVAGVADEVMKSAGYQKPNPAGVDPDFPGGPVDASGITVNPIKNRRDGIQFTPPTGAPSAPGVTVPPNTDPLAPAKPKTPGVGEERGIETNRPDSA